MVGVIVMMMISICICNTYCRYRSSSYYALKANDDDGNGDHDDHYNVRSDTLGFTDFIGKSTFVMMMITDDQLPLMIFDQHHQHYFAYNHGR